MAFVHFGTDLTYGRVDQVPGLFFVATRFFHLQFLPLVPLESYLVLDRRGRPAGSSLRAAVNPARLVRLPALLSDHHDGLPIGLVAKSVYFTWLRLALFAASLGCAVWAACLALDGLSIRAGRPREVLLCDVAPLAVGALFLALTLLTTYRLSRATPQRAFELAERAGIPATAVQPFFPEPGTLKSVGDADGLQ